MSGLALGLVGGIMLLRIQDRILLSLAFLEDLFEDLADAGGLMSNAYENIYGFIPQRYKRSNFYASVSYGLKTGNVEKIKKDGKPHLRLTGRGKKKIIRDFPLFKLQERRWDRLWRMIPYDIEEVSRWQRNRLREKLYQLGFRQFQKSIYLSPHPIEEELSDFLKGLKLQGKVLVVLCHKILGADDLKLARELWRLDELNEQYKKLWERLEEGTSKQSLKEIKREYLDLLSDDPFLPKDLLPKDWYERKLRQILKGLLTK